MMFAYRSDFYHVVILAFFLEFHALCSEYVVWCSCNVYSRLNICAFTRKFKVFNSEFTLLFISNTKCKSIYIRIYCLRLSQIIHKTFCIVSIHVATTYSKNLNYWFSFSWCYNRVIFIQYVHFSIFTRQSTISVLWNLYALLPNTVRTR